MSKPLDLDFIRKQFPPFSNPDFKGQAFFENAGGSFACNQVIDRLCTYYKETKVQPYYPYAASSKAGQAMDESYTSFAHYLNVKPDEVFFGPSTSQNTYVLAQAMRGYLKPGDEIIVTNQDHEANSGAWRRLAEFGMVVKEWQVETENGQLQTQGLKALLSDKTKLVTFPHCSNIVGEINPVKEWAKLAHEVGATVVADGVSYAGHGFPDIVDLGVDIYVFSLYKTYGPHQGAMVIREEIMHNLKNQSHFFNDSEIHKRIIPAGPDHAQVAAAHGVSQYFDAVFEHHFGKDDQENRGRAVHNLFRASEKARLEPLMSYLKDNTKLRVIGSSHLENRAPTIAIVAKNVSSPELVKRLVKHGIMSGYGHFYAARLVEAMGIKLETGVARFSFVHYTSDADIKQLIEALEQEL